MAISTEKMTTYREGLLHRLSRPLTEEERSELDKAYAEAKRLAQTLVEKHGAQRVLLFGDDIRSLIIEIEAEVEYFRDTVSQLDEFRLLNCLEPTRPASEAIVI